jgi:hypothetical protein
MNRPVESLTSGDLQSQLVYPRAVEATIWGMPAVSMAAVRASLPRDLGATYGDIVYFSNVMQPRHEFLTANNQTPYVFTFLNLKDGPVVLEVPPASAEVMFFGSGIDSWEAPLVDVGPTGEDAGQGGKYLFLPPDHTGDAPEGYFVVPSTTYYVHFGLRPITTAKGTLADAVAYSQRLKSYPLANAANPPATRYIDAFPKTWKTLPVFDLSYLKLLNGVIQDEPLQAKDAVMIGMLASLGIEKGKPFQPDDEQAEILAKAVADGAAYMKDYLMNHAFEHFWPDRHWFTNRKEDNHGFTYYGDGKLDYDRRAGGFAYWATWAPKRAGDPTKLPASFYLKLFHDQTGEAFKGDHTYRLHVPQDVPTRDFWSVIAYDVDTNAFIYNDLDRVGLSSYDKDQLQVNADGSVDVYLGPQAPAGKESNWIPTAWKDFWLVFRFYGPQKELFERQWQLDDVEKIS